MDSQRVVIGQKVEQFIHTDPDVAWRAWTDGSEFVRWFPGVNEVHKVGDAPLGVGSKVAVKGAAEAEIEILEFDPGSRVFTYRLPTRYAEFQPHKASVQVKHSLTGTEVDWVLKLDDEGFSFFGIGGKAKRDADLVMTVSLDKLKELLEAEAYSTPEFETDQRTSRWDDGA